MKTFASTSLLSLRLRLRRPVMIDAPVIRDLAGDIEVSRLTAAIPHPYHLGHALEWIDLAITDAAQGHAFTFVIERREEPGVIGAISLILKNDRCLGEAGYWIGKPFWRRGYATEALRELLRHGFEDLGLLCIRAWHIASNPASGRVMEKAGMKFENIVRQGCQRQEELHDVVNYGLFADEWSASARRERSVPSTAWLL